jgi:predicted transcriptional regulator
MAGTPKTDALETLLTEIPQAQTDRETDRSADEDTAFAGKVIIQTILNKHPDPMSQDELMRRSELPADQFERNLAYLVRMGWVETRNSGFQLTDPGREAAEEERKRLLSFG